MNYLEPAHAMSFELPCNPNYFSPEHVQFRDALRAFVTAELIPHVNEWDEAGRFPRELYGRAANIGLLGMGYPEIYGPAMNFSRSSPTKR